MKPYICVPDKSPLPVELLRAIAQKGFHGCRFDLETDVHGVMRAQLVVWNLVPELRPIVLLAGGHMCRADGEAWTGPGLVDHARDTALKLRETGLLGRDLLPVLEIGNEPDLADPRWKKNPGELGRVFADCFAQAREIEPRLTVLCPSVSNLITDKGRGLRYLEKMAPHLPPDCGVAVHRYPEGSDPTTPHEGFRTRSEEVSALRELIGERDLWVTETGFSEWISDERRVSEQHVADYMEADLEFWRTHGAVAAAVYQLNSGRWANEGSFDERRLAAYGIRTIEGTWKPLAERMPRIAEEMA